MSYARTKVWVWFKGGLDGGEWRGSFKDCMVHTWRISAKEPADLKKGPAIPAEAKWKFSG